MGERSCSQLAAESDSESDDRGDDIVTKPVQDDIEADSLTRSVVVGPVYIADDNICNCEGFNMNLGG